MSFQNWVLAPSWLNLFSNVCLRVFLFCLVNGSQSKFFSPRCGHRQGDPLSPYLFTLVGQVLSANLSHFASSAVCKGVAVSSHSPPISHLFFADDSLFFLNFDPAKVWCLKWIIEAYSKFAGQNSEGE